MRIINPRKIPIIIIKYMIISVLAKPLYFAQNESSSECISFLLIIMQLYKELNCFHDAKLALIRTYFIETYQ